MEDNQRQQMREDAPSGSGSKLKKEQIDSVFRELRVMVQAHGYPTKKDRTRGFHGTAGPSQQQKENPNPETSTRKHNLVPPFPNYNDFNKMVLESVDSCMIVLSTDGVILFVDENIVPLLGYLPGEIMKRRLLTFLCDEEKTEVYKKIAFKHPLSKSEGKKTDFCCLLQRGNIKLGEVSCYERVKFILTLRDVFDESFVFFGGYHSKPTYSWLSPENTPLEDRYFLVGFVCLLRAHMLRELCDTKKSNEIIVIYDSDDESSSEDHGRGQKQGKHTRTRALCGESSAASLNDQNEPMNVQQSVPQDNANVIETVSVSDMNRSSSEIMQGSPVCPVTLKLNSENGIALDEIEQEDPDLGPFVSFIYFEDSESQDGSLNIAYLNAQEDSVGLAAQEAAGTNAQMWPTTSAHIASPEPQSSEATFKTISSVKKKRSDPDLKENKRFCDSTHSSTFSEEPVGIHVCPIQKYLEEHERHLQIKEKYLQDQQLKLQKQMNNLEQQMHQHQMMQKTLQEQRQEQRQQSKQNIIIPVQIVEPQKCSDSTQEAISEDQEHENYSFLLEELPGVLVDLQPLTHTPGFETGPFIYVPQSMSAESDNVILDSTDIFMQMWQNMPSSSHLIALSEETWLNLQHNSSGNEPIRQQQAEALDKSDEQLLEPRPM